MTVAWSGRTYQTSWRRQRTNAEHCDLCASAWMGCIPPLVARDMAASERRQASMAARTAEQIEADRARMAELRARRAG